MRKQSTSRKGYVRRRGWFRFCRAVAILIVLGAALTVGFIGGLFASVARSLPEDEALSNIRPPTPTRVLAADGSLLGRIFLPDQNRELVPFTRMGHMVNATIAIEDERFYAHPGVDVRGIMRATVQNLKARDTKEGASTITQQLARNLFLHREKKFSRKLREVMLALELERRYSKNEILETYLNQVFYGSNQFGTQSWGAQMAAQNYFNKNVEDLTLAEAALLAGLPKNPRDNNPYAHPERAVQRRNLVLKLMLDNALISPEDHAQARETPLKLAPEKQLTIMADYHAPYFVRHILVTEMRRIFGQEAHQLIYGYGVDIYTSLDPRMQKVAEETVTSHVQRNRFRRLDEGALISIDPKTGLIKAMVGGTDFRHDQYNVITQGRRQPGSAFKPFIYVTALLRGYTPETIVHDKPSRYPSGYGQFWSPKNSDGNFRGPMTLKSALWLSRNVPAAQVAYELGIKDVIRVAYRMGIKHRLEPHLATSLGSSVVVPMEICSAYGTIANGGVHHPPTGVLRVVTQEGDVLYEYRANPTRALPAKVADTMQEVLVGAIERGTGRAARCPFPAAGKTGTTNDYRDAWFIGFTDNLVTAVWVGNRNNSPMNRTFGGTVPAPIWREFMLVAQPIMAAEHKERQDRLAVINNLPDMGMQATETAPEDGDTTADGETDPPPGATEETRPVPLGREYSVAICGETGDRAVQWCPDKVMVTYTRGSNDNPPGGYCVKHAGPEDVPNADGSTDSARGGLLISICAETGKIASDRCSTVLLRRFRGHAPTETCPLHGGQ